MSKISEATPQTLGCNALLSIVSTGKLFAIAPSVGSPMGINAIATLQVFPSGKPFANAPCAGIFLDEAASYVLKLDATTTSQNNEEVF